MSVVLWFVACTGDTSGTGDVVGDGTPNSDLVDSDVAVDTDTDTTPPPIGDVGANGALTLSPNMGTLVFATWDELYASDATWLSWEIDNITYTTPVVAREIGPATQTLLGAPSNTTLDVVLHAMVNDEEQIWYVGSIKTDVSRAICWIRSW